MTTVLDFEADLARLAKERQRDGGQKVPQPSAEPQVRDQLALHADVSHDTMSRGLGFPISGAIW